MTINLIQRKSFKQKLWKTLNVVVGVTTILNISMVGTLMVPTTTSALEVPTPDVADVEATGSTNTAGANGAVCPQGNVKYEIPGGYEYTNDSATVSGDEDAVAWQAASGFVIGAVCIKIGGSGGGSLIYPDPASGQGGPYSHGISHVVLYTRTTSNQCALYGMQDQNTVDSLLFKINPTNGQYTQIGSVRENYDIEAMDAHPDTEVIYGMSGAEDAPETMKRILIIDPVTGIPDVSTGVPLTIESDQEIQGASFNPITKELWVAGDHGFDIRTLDYNTGISTPKKDVSGSPETLAWNANGTKLYYTVDDDLKSYNPSTNDIASVCSNVGGEVEGMEFDDLGNLVIGIHGDTKLYKINPQTCVKTPYYQLGAFDDVETLTSACPKPVTTKLTLIKNVVNDNGGNAGPNAFGLEIDGQTVNSGVPTPVEANTDIEINETGLAGYEFVEITGDEGCPEELGDTVTLNEGENLTCTITNNDIQPKLTVTKVVINDNGGNAQVSDFPLFVDAAPVTSGVQNGFNAGQYIVSETTDPDYAWSISGDCAANGSITLNPGDVKECTITNDDAPVCHLEITKAILVNQQPVTQSTADPGDEVTYRLNFQNTGTATCTGGGVKVQDVLNSNLTYVSSSEQHSSNVDFGYGSTPGHSNGTLTWNAHNLTPGENGWVEWRAQVNTQPACTDLTIPNHGRITSAEYPGWPSNPTWVNSNTVETSVSTSCQGKLTVTKVVVNDNGGTKVVSNFPLFVDATPVTSGVQNNFNAGQYTVSETNQAGYTATISGDCASNGSITLNPGDVKSCTITNDDVLPTIMLDKQSQATVIAGDNIIYTLAWAVGAAPVTNAIITDTVPANTTFVSAGCGTTSGTCIVNTATSTISWNLGSRNPGESSTVTLTVKSNSPLTNGTVITNTGTFDTDQTNPVSDTVTTTVSSLPVLGIQKSVNPTTVPAGQNVTWTVKWTVSGNASATNVVIIDPIPANSTFVSVADAGVYDAVTNKITWNLGTQSPGASGEVHYVIKAASPIANNTVITNTATIDSAETDPPISASASVTITSAPDLTITKINDIQTFTNPGKALTYTVTVTNKAAATDTAKNVVLTDTLPAGFTFAVDGTTTKSFTIGNLTPGQSATITYLVNISGTQVAGTFNNSAKAKGDNTNEVSAVAPVEVRVPIVLGIEALPDLTIEKTASKTTAKPGDVITYSITVRNTGDADANNVVVTDTLPKDLSFVHAKGRTMQWDIGTLAPGRSRVIDVDVRVESDAKKGDYVNVATVAADDVPQKEVQAKITVRVPKVLGLAKTGPGALDLMIALIGVALITLGVLGLRRRGTSVTDLSDDWQLTQNLVLSNQEAPMTISSTNKRIIEGGSMNNLLHNKRTVRTALTAGITVGVLALARLAGAQVVGPSPQDPVQLTKPVLEVTKTADVTTAKPGDVITYTVTVKNTGAAAATGVKLSDILPIGFTVTTNNQNAYDFTFLGQLDPGQTTSTSYSAKVGDVTANGEYVNVGTVSASNHDPVTVRSTVNVNIPVVKGVTTEKRGEQTSGTVLGTEDELVATGPGALDLLIALAGLGIIGAGILGLRRARRSS